MVLCHETHTLDLVSANPSAVAGVAFRLDQPQDDPDYEAWAQQRLRMS